MADSAHHNGIGYTDGELSPQDVTQVVSGAFSSIETAGRRILFLIPDHSRTCPLGMLFREVYAQVADSAAALDFMVALGTHPPMSMEHIYERVEITAEEHRSEFPKATFLNHHWDDPGHLADVGTLSRDEIGEITGGLFHMDVTITCNRAVLEHDLLIILGPVFPHEVVGFSGGNKYIFPGIAGHEIIDFFHWLGAIITNPVIIGNKWTPVRAVVDRAAALLDIERRALCMVVKGSGLAGLYHGTPEEAWSSAADLSRELHITYKDKPYTTVFACCPEMYDDVWTGGKCMYKTEPVVVDGGTVIIYAPHITEVSAVHGEVIEAIGYHTRDYFRKQWDDFKHLPWGLLAHSTHVKGIGSFEDGVETPRVNVVLATGISEDMCRQINMGYMDPATIRKEDYMNREDEGVLFVAKAGETLYRWKDAPPVLGGEGSMK